MCALFLQHPEVEWTDISGNVIQMCDFLFTITSLSCVSFGSEWASISMKPDVFFVVPCVGACVVALAFLLGRTLSYWSWTA